MLILRETLDNKNKYIFLIKSILFYFFICNRIFWIFYNLLYYLEWIWYSYQMLPAYLNRCENYLSGTNHLTLRFIPNETSCTYLKLIKFLFFILFSQYILQYLIF